MSGAWTSRRAALLVGAFAVVLTLANAVLLWIGRTTMNTAENDLFFGVISVIGSVLYIAIGLLIAVRARSMIGWFLAGVGIAFNLLTFGNAYGAVGLVTHPGSLPAAEKVGTALSQVWMFGLVGISVLLLLFPSGRPPSARWRPVVWIAGGGVVASYVLFLLKPMSIAPIQSTGSFPNPFAIRVRFIGPALVATSWVTVLAVAGCLAGLVQRFRHGDAELRQQIKWLGLLAAIGAGCVLIAIAGLVGCQCDESPIAVVAFFVLILIVLFGVPAAIAVALFKYRLYDLDLVVNKALVYGLLAAAFTLVYVAIVIGVGTVVGARGNSFLTIVAAVAIAVGFQPIRQRVTRLANRLVYGRRATPYEVLSEFADRVATEYAAEDVLARMAQILANGTGATSARVWLRFDDEIRTAASWPENGADTSVGVAEDHPRRFEQGETGAEVRHQGELLGALSVTMPPNDPMNSSKERLVRDLAAQAGLVLRNVRLIEELRASRRRIVTAQDDRAKQLERNIHDGAQQQLVALGVQLGLAHRIAERSAPDVAELLDRLREQATDALENLRDLARGIYPPLLADQGLVAALEAQARKAAIPVQVEAGAIGRHPQKAEAAVYFCCLEALQNVAKYANASAARVRLFDRDGMLRFAVSDDGNGFDPARAGLGSGLQGMKDRLEALGGSFEISSRPGAGTVVDGAIPLAKEHVTDRSSEAVTYAEGDPGA
jgi:signal transduction histidine kinase